MIKNSFPNASIFLPLVFQIDGQKLYSYFSLCKKRLNKLFIQTGPKSTEFARKQHLSRNLVPFTFRHASGVKCSPSLSTLAISDFPFISSSKHWRTDSLGARTTLLPASEIWTFNFLRVEGFLQFWSW